MKTGYWIGWGMVWSLLAATGWGQEAEPRATGLFGRCAEREDAVALPLEAMAVKAVMTAGYVEAEVSQTYTNPTASRLEAIYIFPLPSRAAVTDMQIRIGDRLIRSVVQEREQAKKTYEAAKAEGKTTAMVEQERPNIFTTSIANIPTGACVDVVLRYLEPLDLQKGHYRMTFPTVIGERYCPMDVQPVPGGHAATPAVPDAQRLNPPVAPDAWIRQRLSFELELIGIPVTRVVSSTHALQVEAESADHTVVTLADAVRPNCDLAIDVQVDCPEAPRVSWMVTDGTQGDAFGLLNLFPDAAAGPADRQARDVVFIIDTSGSMQGDSISQARAGLLACMDRLQPDDRFNIIRFASSHSSFAPEMRDVGPDRLAAARAFIDGLAASGGTEMQPALQDGLAMLGGSTAIPIVILLTDGDVGDENRLMRLLSAHLGRARLFTFGIGSAPNEYLMRKMAELGRGQSRFIHSHEDVGTVMRDFFATMEAAVLTDIALEWLDAQGQVLSAIKVFPHPVPDVFLDRPLQAVVRFTGTNVPVALRITGRRGDEPWSMEQPLREHAEGPQFLPQLFARQKIDELMYEILVADAQDAKQVRIAEVTDLGLRYQLVTRYTARVAVEETVTADPEGHLQTVRVPVPAPRGWTMYGLCATGTHDLLWVLLAGLSAAGAWRARAWLRA